MQICRECTIAYRNYFSYPFSMLYSYPPFASFSSLVVSSYIYNGDPSVGFPGLYLTANQSVEYYSSSNVLLASQPMVWIPGDTGSLRPANPGLIFTLSERPAYAKISVAFSVGGFYAETKTVVMIAEFP